MEKEGGYKVLRRDLLKGILGLVGGGILLKDLEEEASSISKEKLIKALEIPFLKDNSNIGGYCRNEFMMYSKEDIKPGDRLYSHNNLKGVSTKISDHYVGIALSNKDKWDCCKVALYLNGGV